MESDNRISSNGEIKDEKIDMVIFDRKESLESCNAHGKGVNAQELKQRVVGEETPEKDQEMEDTECLGESSEDLLQNQIEFVFINQSNEPGNSNKRKRNSKSKDGKVIRWRKVQSSEQNVNVDCTSICDSKKFKCEFCEYTASYLTNLRLHMKIVHSKTLKIIRRSQEDHVETHLECIFCEFSTPDEKNLKEHIDEKHDGFDTLSKKFKCDQCAFSTNFSASLDKHARYAHSKEKQHKCNFCPYTSFSRKTLEYHMETKHRISGNSKKEFECDRCDFSSFHLKNLKRHVRSVHLKKRFYNCRICGYRASGLGDLKQHREAQHKNFKCKYCVYTTYHQFLLKQHVERIHMRSGRHVCETCGYIAADAKSLDYHVELEHDVSGSDRTKLQCDRCEFTTVIPNVLKIHASIHLKGLCHKCSLCDYSTFDTNYLNIHMESRHKSCEVNKDVTSELDRVKQT